MKRKLRVEGTIRKYMRAVDRCLALPASTPATGSLNTKEALRDFLVMEERWRLLLALRLPIKRSAINLLLGWVGLGKLPHPRAPSPYPRPPPPPPMPPSLPPMTVDFLTGENIVVLEEEGKGIEDEGGEGGSGDMKKMLQTLDVTSLQKGLDAMKEMLELM
jgi:hypothetical protein